MGWDIFANDFPLLDGTQQRLCVSLASRKCFNHRTTHEERPVFRNGPTTPRVLSHSLSKHSRESHPEQRFGIVQQGFQRHGNLLVLLGQ